MFYKQAKKTSKRRNTSMNLFIKQKVRNLFRILVMILLSIGITYIVWATGGTSGVWPQLNFIIIILAAYYFNIPGGIVSAVILGIMNGPWMPLNVAKGIMQTPQNWIVRLCIYSLMGFLAGYIFQKNEKMNQDLREKDLTSNFTGLYNTNKLFLDLNEMIKQEDDFCLVFFKIKNLEEISKYVDYQLKKEIIQHTIETIQSRFEDGTLYSIHLDEYVLVLKKYDEQALKETLTKSLKTILKTVHVEEGTIPLVVKVGIVFKKEHQVEVLTLFNKARVAADQGEDWQSEVYTYDAHFHQKRRMFIEISGSIPQAIKNKELYLVYQPIIDLNDNTISSLEVLVRWNRGGREAVGPGTFVKIAEETGSIQHITKEVITQLIHQLKDWQKEQIRVKASINATAEELIDGDFYEWVKTTFDAHQIERSQLGIEITERVYNGDIDRLKAVLKSLQSKGYSVSIDDFGTGYNTLKKFQEIQADVVKIDKYFIDKISEEKMQMLVKELISFLHKLNILVVAEGVETKEQLMMLKAMHCDRIQGYYFSKPLRAEAFSAYYKNFDIKDYID